MSNDKPQTNMVKYNSYDLEAVDQEREEATKTGGEFIKVKEGQNVYRFLPPIGAMRSPFVLAHQHYIELPGMKNAVSFNCPRVMSQQPCPACQKMEQLRGTGNKADYDVAGKLFPSLRVYAFVIDRDAPELGPQKYAFGKKVLEQLNTIRADKVAGGDFTDPTEDGFDIVVNRTGQGLKTVYQVSAARASSPLGDMAWIEMQGNLLSYARVDSYEDILQKLAEAGMGLARPQAAARAPYQAPGSTRVEGSPRTRTAAADMSKDPKKE